MSGKHRCTSVPRGEALRISKRSATLLAETGTGTVSPRGAALTLIRDHDGEFVRAMLSAYTDRARFVLRAIAVHDDYQWASERQQKPIRQPRERPALNA